MTFLRGWDQKVKFVYLERRVLAIRLTSLQQYLGRVNGNFLVALNLLLSSPSRKKKRHSIQEITIQKEAEYIGETFHELYSMMVLICFVFLFVSPTKSIAYLN